MAEFGASSFCRDCSTAVDLTVGFMRIVVEDSGFRGAGDLSAPWLRHSGRDDSGVVATAVEMTVRGGYCNVWCDGGVYLLIRHFDCRFRRNRNGEISCSRDLRSLRSVAAPLWSR